MQFPDVVMLSIPLFVALMVAGILWITLTSYQPRDTTAALLMGVGNVLAGMVLFVGGINVVYRFWIHTETINRLPRRVAAVMNSPRHHRVHHGRSATAEDIRARHAP